MIYSFLCRSFLLLFRLPLFSVASSAVAAFAASGQTIFYPIDSSQRGIEIVNTFNNLLSHASGIQYPEIALQTTLGNVPYTSYSYMNVGIIPFIQKITQTPNNTLLIITYITSRTTSTNQYIVLPPEQVVAMLYFNSINNQPLSNSVPFNASPIPGTYPYFSVDPKQRSIDIASAITQLKSAPFATKASQVWVQTMLSGPFAPANIIPNGLLKNVLSVSLNNSLLVLQFQPPNYAVQTVVLAPEQVQQITYVLNPNSP